MRSVFPPAYYAGAWLGGAAGQLVTFAERAAAEARRSANYFWGGLQAGFRRQLGYGYPGEPRREKEAA